MDSSEELEYTQVLQDVILENPQDRLEKENQKVACLSINDRQFPIFNGDTFIGRDPKRCTIVLDRKSVSSHHALIEVESGHHLICDLGSSNSTRLNGMILKPHVRYSLTNNADVQFADLQGLYKIESLNSSGCDTSSDDMFATPAMSCDVSTRRSINLNLTGDDSVIGSTPIRSEFKRPQPRTASIPSFYSPGIYEADTQTSESDTSLFNDSLNSSNCKTAVSSFVVPCTQEQSADSSIQLHYETDQSMNNTSLECAKETASLLTDKVASEAYPSSELNNTKDMKDNECDAIELSDVEQKFIEEEMERIERSYSSELDCISERPQDIEKDNLISAKSLSNQVAQGCPRPKNFGEPYTNTSAGLPSDVDAGPSGSKRINEEVYGACTEMPQDKDAKTQMLDTPAEKHKEKPDSESKEASSGKYKMQSSGNIHEAATQIVDAGASDSETDDEEVYGACTEMPQDKDNIHDAKTQMLDIPAEKYKKKTDSEGKGASSSKCKLQNLGNIHEAATQVVDAGASDSETDDEGVYGACTEMPQDKDSIHDAKTQMLDVPAEKHEEKPAAESKVASSSKSKVHNLGNIHEAATQIVDAGASDSETDDEEVYGACTEMPQDKDSIHDAKTQMLDISAEKCKEKQEAENKEVLSSKCNVQNLGNIDEAATQIVDAGASDSETDDEEVYRACTKMPQDKDGIHDDKTQMLDTPREKHEEKPDAESKEASSSKFNNCLGNIHEAATQIIDTGASDSETDDEGVYGACTEMPQDKGSIHDAKTQMLDVPAEKHEEKPAAESKVASSSKSKVHNLGNIHEAATQIVDAGASDSETDDEEVYGACTEMPQDKDSIHDAKTQMLDAPAEKHEEIQEAKSKEVLSSKCNVQNLDNIHGVPNQIVDAGGSNSGTDDEEVYGACTEMPQDKDSIHDAKTQMLDAPAENHEEQEEAESNQVLSSKCKVQSLGNIHEAATQIVNAGGSYSETNDDEDYGACTEMPQDKDAKTQIIDTPAEKHKEKPDSESKKASSSKCKMQSSGNIHEAATQIVGAGSSDSETADEGVYGACTEIPQDKDSIHDAKTQMLDIPAEKYKNKPDSESKEASSSKCKVQNLGNIHEAATQVVDAGASDSETDDEGVYGACTEMPQDKDSIHDAKTQMLDAPAEKHEEKPAAESKVASSSKSIVHNLGNIHEAATQIVDAGASDSETDDEEVYRACTKMPLDKDSIHDAKTQMLDAPAEKHEEKPAAESKVASSGKSKVHNLGNIHEAATQIVDAGASDSETDDEGVYGACTEMPRDKDSIHDAKTQMLDAPAEKHEEKPAAESKVASSGKSKVHNLGNIHEAATQIVDAGASDSETDDEGVYGACTEMPRDKDSIHDAKTQMLDAPAEKHEEKPAAESKVVSSGKSKVHNLGNIHEAATQIVDAGASDSGTDDEGVYGACTEMPQDKDSIHDAETQMLDIPSEKCKEEPAADSKEASSSKCYNRLGNLHNVDSAETSVEKLSVPKCESHSNTASLKTSELFASQKNYYSVRKRLSLARNTKVINQSLPSITASNNVVGTPEKSLSFVCSDNDQLLLTSNQTPISGDDTNESVDLCLEATQILPCPSHVVSVRTEQDEDIFTAATQILVSPVSKPISCVEEDIFTAATQILDSPGCSKSLVCVKEEASPSGGKIGVAAISVDGRKGTNDSTKQSKLKDIVSKGQDERPSTSSRITTKDQRGQTDSSYDYSNALNCRRVKTCSKTLSRKCKKKKLLGSTPPEGDIEDTSSDSAASLDQNIEDDNDDNINSLDTIKSVAPLQERASKPKKESNVSSSVSQEAVSPIFARNSGRRTLSLSRSRSNVNSQESSTKEAYKDLKLSDSQTVADVSSQQVACGVIPLITVQGVHSENAPFKNASDQAREKKLQRRSPRNSRVIELNNAKDAANGDCTSEELLKTNNTSESILKVKQDTGPSRKSVSFKASVEVTSTEKLDETRKLTRKNSMKRTSSRSEKETHYKSGEITEDKEMRDDGPPLELVKTKKSKDISGLKLDTISRKSDSQKSSVSKDLGGAEHTDTEAKRPRRGRKYLAESEKIELTEINKQSIDIAHTNSAQETSKQAAERNPVTGTSSHPSETHTQIEIKRSVRGRKQPDEPKNIEQTDLNNQSVNFPKPKPAKQSSKRKAESNSATEELSDPSSQGHTQTETKRRMRGKKQPAEHENKEQTEINKQSVNFAMPKPTTRNSKRKAENAAISEELSQPFSETSNSSQENNSVGISTRRSTRTRKQKISESSEEEHPTKRLSKSMETTDSVEGSLASSSESLSSIPNTEHQTGTRKSSRSRKLPTKLNDNTTISLLVKEQDSGQAHTSTRTRSRKVVQKNTEEETEGTTIQPVLESSLVNSDLDRSLSILSLKREGDLDENDDLLESKRPKLRRTSVASTSTSPRRSPRPRLGLKGTTTNTIHVLFSFLNNPRHENLVKQLGGVTVTSVDSANVLVTDKLRRTVKLLCFLGKGLPVVGPQWLLHSEAAGRLVDPWEHILSDKEAEMKFNANLRESLTKAGQNPVLQGYHIYVTKNVKPEPEEIKAIVSSSGGVVLSRAPSVWPSNSIAISCLEDKHTWTKLKNKVPVVSAEWLLRGVLQQHLNIEEHILK